MAVRDSSNPFVAGEVLLAGDLNDTFDAAGGGVEGSSYVFVAGNGTASENGTELQAAYTAAKALTPYGNALSNTNRATVVVAPGTYDTQLIMDAQFVNLVSLDGGSKVAGQVYRSVRIRGLRVEANNVLVRGFENTDTNSSTGGFHVLGNLPGVVVEKCTGNGFLALDSNLFDGLPNTSTYIDCVGNGNRAFANYDANGTYIDCQAFGGEAWGQVNSFETTGFFVRCTAQGSAFGRIYTLGTFIECTADFDAFGSVADGVYFRCVAGARSFGFTEAGGTFVQCISGSDSFGHLTSLTGLVLWCRRTAGTYRTPTGAGKIRMSLDGTFNQINLG